MDEGDGHMGRKQGRSILISACGDTYVENSVKYERTADCKLNYLSF